FKVARLLSEARPVVGVEAGFVSLARPSVPEVLDRCRRLGATHVTVAPYFLFTGVLVERIVAQARAWATDEGDVAVTVAGELGPDPRIAGLVLERYHEALAGGARMNCDLCLYRSPLPGHPARH
ncbi:MAG: CbiX/SirB N-terminal domain-containing protein, partial [Acidimicrobiales bacterium]